MLIGNFNPVLSLNAVDGTRAQPGTVIDMLTTRLKHAIQVTATGGPTTGVVSLMGSLNGANWFSLGTWTLPTQASGDIVFSLDKPVRFLRADITTAFNGTTPKVSAWVAAAG